LLSTATPVARVLLSAAASRVSSARSYTARNAAARETLQAARHKCYDT
jgi:hypothetical protein